MSADDWRECPNCIKKAEEELGKVYGKVGKEEYLKLQKELTAVEEKETLRIDREYGVDKKGNLYVNFGAGCEECGFSGQMFFDEAIHEIVKKDYLNKLENIKEKYEMENEIK